MNILKKIKKIKLDTFKRQNSMLGVFSLKNLSNISIKRLFYISANRNEIRGKHAHKKTNQIFFCLSGSVLIEASTPNETVVFKLNANDDPIIIPPRMWVVLQFKKKSIIGVLCDSYFDENEYIRSKEIFNKNLY